MNKFYLLYDVGGTNIKIALMKNDGTLFNNSYINIPSMSNESKEIIFNNIVSNTNTLLDCVNDYFVIDGIGMAFPGPFDYENGISLMKDIRKYDSIYKCNIKNELKDLFLKSKNKNLFSSDLRFVFLNDVEAFALGQCNYGKCKDFSKVFYLCIGTGAGSAFTENRRIIKKPNNVVPENGWIYPTPFKDGIIDDYICARGISKIGYEIFNKNYTPKEIFEMAISGDKNALKVFNIFGEDLVNAISTFLVDWSANCIVLGGQIVKSFDFFGSKLKELCKESNIEIVICDDTSKSAFYGLYHIL